jgi:PAS domain S-box-containing protein
MIRINNAGRLYLMIGIALLMMSGLIGYGFFIGEKLYSAESPLLNTIGEIELEASRIRFWMDDVLAGHEKYEVDDARWNHIDQSLRYLNSLVQGKQVSVLDLNFRGDRNISKQIPKLHSLLDDWKYILLKFNSQQPKHSQPGKLRTEMAGAFSDFSGTLSEIKDFADSTIKKSVFRFRIVQGILIGVSVLLTALAAGTIFRYERERSLALEQLNKGRKDLEQELAQRREAQVALAEREQLLRTVFNSSPVALVVTRLADSRVVDVNDSFVATSGYEKAEVLGHTFQGIHIWEDQTGRDSVLRRLTQDRQVRNLELRFRIKDGSVRIFLLSANIVEINGEEHILSSALDVTERKEAEAKILWLASFPMLNPFPVVEVDLEGHVHYLNPAAEKVFPDLSRQGAGHAWLSPWESVTRPFRNGEYKTADREVFFDGKWYHQSLSWTGQVNRIRIHGMDITARKQAEETLKTSHDALEAWVDERTRQLQESNQRLKAEVEERTRTERSLLQHQLQLRKLSAALTQTEERERRRIATAIHDSIGQTLAATQIELGVMRACLPPGKIVGQLDGIRGLLSSAIDETRSLTFELSPPVLYEIGLRSALEWMAERFHQKYSLRVTVNGNGSDRSLPIPLRVFFFQAANELCFNVVKHAGATEIKVFIRGDAEVVLLDVVDNGTGFDVGGHCQNAAAEMGFGLFSIREQLRHYGGTLTLDTAPGRGTRVALKLPLKIEPELQEGIV